MSKPVYIEIVLFLRAGILKGEYPGGKIPGTRLLARKFHTSRSTVSHAYAQLEKDGLIARYPYKPPLIIAKAQPYPVDSQFIEATTRDGHALFCKECWAYVHFAGPGTRHVC